MSRKRSLAAEPDDSDIVDNNNSDTQTSSSIKRFKSSTSNFDPTKVLSFVCKNQQLKVDYWSEDHNYNVEYFVAAKTAFLDYKSNFQKHGFQENVKKTNFFLYNYGFSSATTFEKVINHNKRSKSFFESKVINSCEQVTDLLNEKYIHHPFIVLPKVYDTATNSESLVVVPTGMLLLQTISQCLYCSFLVFSTRASPVLIKPFIEESLQKEYKRERKPLPMFVILHHVDSYVPQNTHWCPLDFTCEPRDAEYRQHKFIKNNSYDRHQPTNIINSNQNYEAIYTPLEENQSRRARSKSMPTKDLISDDEILSSVTSAINAVFSKKYKKLKKKNKELTIDMFVSGEQSSTSSLPSVIPKVRKTLESTIPKEKVPENNTWLNSRWDKIKKKGRYDLKYFLDYFKENFEENFTLEEIPAVTRNKKSTKVDQLEEDSNFLEALETNEEDNATQEEFRTIAVTLRKVLKEKIDYKEFLHLLTDYQKVSSNCMHGIQHVISVITNLVLNGSFSRALGNEDEVVNFFDYSKLNIANLQITEESDNIALMDENILFNSKGLFSFKSIYQLLSCCVGSKSKINRTPLMDIVIENMDTSYQIEFTSSPYVLDALKKFQVNFENFWNDVNFDRDLTAVIRAFLKIKFPKKRKKSVFSNNQQLQPTSAKTFNTKKSKKKRLLKRLEKEIVKRDGGKMYIVEQLVDKTFNITPSSVVSSIISAEPIVTDDDSTPIDDPVFINEGNGENEEDQEMYTANNGLTAAQIRPLVAVCKMLIKSPRLKNAVDGNYFKKQLYAGTQEMDQHVYDECANLVNLLRTISPTTDNLNGNILMFFQMRQLNNVLCRHAKDNNIPYIRYKVKKMNIASDKNTIHALDVQPRSLYLMMRRHFDMFTIDESNYERKTLTSATSVISQHNKMSLLRNFFNVDYLYRRFTEQDLQPIWRFSFVDEYHVSFLGKMSKSSTTESPLLNTPLPHPKKNVTLNDAEMRRIKELKQEKVTTQERIQILKEELKFAEEERMDCANSFRKKEKEGVWDIDLYHTLKGYRSRFSSIFKKIQDLKQKVVGFSCEIRTITTGPVQEEEINDQVDAVFIDQKNKLAENLQKNGNIVINGIDPGICSTVTMFSSTSNSFFSSLNRYNVLLDDEDGPVPVDESHIGKSESRFLNVTPSFVNNVNFSSQHRKKREKKQKNGDNSTNKQLSKQRLTRKIRLAKCNAKIISQYRSNKRSRYYHFFGDWGGQFSNVKGIESRRSFKPIIPRLRSVKTDTFKITNEYNSTVTCNSCFEKTIHQIHRLPDGSIRRAKGAVVCFNPHCPKKKSQNGTTTNRDQNGAQNIALIGFSSLVSKDNNPLPPFMQNHTKKTKFILDAKFQQFLFSERREELPVLNRD